MTMLNRDIFNTNEDKLRNWYNNIKVWLSTSELEGLHNPPMESALCGCCLISTDHFMSGTVDYVIDNETALLYPARDLNRAHEHLKRLLNDEQMRTKLNKNLVKLLYEKIGSRKQNMLKMIKYLEK